MDKGSNNASALHARIILMQEKRRAAEAKSVYRRVAASAQSVLARVVGSLSSSAPVPPLGDIFPQQLQEQQLQEQQLQLQQQQPEALVAVRQSFGYSLTNVFS